MTSLMDGVSVSIQGSHPIPSQGQELHCKVGCVAALIWAAQKCPSINLINAFLTSYLTDIYSSLSPFIHAIQFSMT